VSPWFYAEQLPMDEFRYRGRAYDIKVSIALANSGGNVQLELIQQRCESPSLYRDFLAAGHEGMQHWSSWPVNYREIRERALRTGWGRSAHEGDTPRGPFIYFLNEGHPGTVVANGRGDADPMRIFDQGPRGCPHLGWKRPDSPELCRRGRLGGIPGCLRPAHCGARSMRWRAPGARSFVHKASQQVVLGHRARCKASGVPQTKTGRATPRACRYTGSGIARGTRADQTVRYSPDAKPDHPA